MRKDTILIISILFFNYISFSQISSDIEPKENSSNNHDQSDHDFKKHDITFIIGHTHIGSGLDSSSGKKEWLVLPSFELNYNFHFNEKWALGVHNHMIIEEFLVTGEDSHESDSRSDDEVVGIERDKPISVTLVASYKIHKHIALIAGGGVEFSSHENYKVIKFGIEFPFHIPNDWEVIGGFVYDINIDAYESFTLGMGIAKLF